MMHSNMKKRKNLMALILAASMSLSGVGITPPTSAFALENDVATATDSTEISSQGDAEYDYIYSAQDFESETNSGIKVRAFAETDIFPDNTTMVVSDVSAEKTEELTSKLDGEVQDAIAVDIAFYNEFGEEIEPKDGKAVDVSIELPEEKELEGGDFELLHYDEENDEIEKIDNIEADSTGVEFSNGEFSIYVFTTNGYVEKDKVTGIVGESGGSNRIDNPYYLKVGQAVTLRTDDITNGFSIPAAYSDYLQITSSETVEVNGVSMIEAVVEAKKSTSDLSNDVAIVMQDATSYYIRILDPDTVTGSYDHSDIEISEGVQYISKEATVYADGTVKTVERTYNMYVAHVDRSELYGIKKGETTETRLAEYKEYMYELLNGSQHEYTSKYYALWNPEIGGFHDDVQRVDRSSKITRAVFYLDIGLEPVSEKTTIKKIDGTKTVTENPSFKNSGDSILQNQEMECGEQMVIDANNACPWHDGFDFSINGSVMNNIVATPEKLQLSAKKNLTGRNLKSDEFTFELYDDTGVIDTAKCDSSGNVVFDEIYYLDAQGASVKNEGLIYSTPGTYTYHIREVLPTDQSGTVTEKDGVTYDDSVIDVTVTVTRREVKTTINGKVITSYVLDVNTVYTDSNGNILTGAEFNNVFTPVERNIEGVAWLDTNEDGKIDAGETKLDNVTVQLVDPDGKVVATATTDSEGKYKFSDVPAGTYEIVVNKDLDTTEKKEDNKADGGLGTDGSRYGKISGIVLPTDDEIRADSSIVIGTDGKKVYNLMDQNAGFINDPAVVRNIEGIAWVDADKDGIIDTNEEKLIGKTVQLIDKDGNVVKEVTTGSDGSYKFENVDSGKYDIFVKVDMDTTVFDEDNLATKETETDGTRYGKIASILLPTDDEIIKNPSIPKVNGEKTFTVKDQNAGFVNPEVERTIEGIAWLDTNEDGKIDTDETKFSGKTVQLIDENGNVVDEVTTTADGCYKFEKVPAGEYDICVKVDLDTTGKKEDNLADGDSETDGTRYGRISSVKLPTDDEIIKDSSIPEENGKKTYSVKNQNSGFVEDAKKENPPKKEETTEETPKKEETTEETPTTEETTPSTEETTKEKSNKEETTEESSNKETTNKETTSNKESTPSKTVESGGNNLTTTVGEKTDTNKNTDKPAANTSKSVHTGDNAPLVILFVLLMLSVAGIGFVITLKKRKRA